MKKALLLLILPVFLCGCDANSKNNSEYLISALGFDSINGEYSLCAEAITVNTEEPEQSTLLITGRGASLKEAFEMIFRQSTQDVSLSHCGTLIIGESITDSQFNEICSYVYKNKIVLSCQLVKSENAQSLLSCDKVSSVAVGYDIMGLLEHSGGLADREIHNRLFEILSSAEKGEKPDLPFIAVNGKGYCLAEPNSDIH